jgi:hypothetical protein
MEVKWTKETYQGQDENAFKSFSDGDQGSGSGSRDIPFKIWSKDEKMRQALFSKPYKQGVNQSRS